MSLKQLAVLGLLAFAVTSLQANILPAPSVQFTVVLCGNGTPQCQQLVNTPTGPISYSNTITQNGASITLNASAAADLATGELGAFESYSLSGSTTFFTQVNSGAFISDIVTIPSPGLDGTVGSLAPVFDASGTVTPSGLGDVGFIFQDSVGNNPPAPQGRFFAGNAHLVFNPVTFHYGQPFLFDYFLSASTFPDSTFLTGTSDYSHTSVFRGFQLFNANDQPVSNATITSELGTGIAVLTPEPGSFLLIGAGLLAVGALRARKH